METEEPEKTSSKRKLDDISSGDRIIVLRVGGTEFETRLSTLQKYPNTFLGAMFSHEDMPPKAEEDGSYFIDQDPTYFRFILESYRNGAVLDSESIILQDPIEKAMWVGQLKFFGFAAVEEPKEPSANEPKKKTKKTYLEPVHAMYDHLIELFKGSAVWSKHLMDGKRFSWQIDSTTEVKGGKHGVDFWPIQLIRTNKEGFKHCMEGVFNMGVSISCETYGHLDYKVAWVLKVITEKCTFVTIRFYPKPKLEHV